MNAYQKYFEVNKQTWNKKVAVHTKSEMYNLKAFKKGESSFKKYELEVLQNKTVAKESI